MCCVMPVSGRGTGPVWGEGAGLPALPSSFCNVDIGWGGGGGGGGGGIGFGGGKGGGELLLVGETVGRWRII